MKEIPQYFAYYLDHQYTDNDLRLAHLKGDDYHRACHVAKSCAVHGEFYLLLANMSMSITYPGDQDEDENEGENGNGELDQIPEFKLSRVVDLEGFQLSHLNDLEISHTQIWQTKSYRGRKPDVRKGGEYMGNSHAEIEQFFKDSVS